MALFNQRCWEPPLYSNREFQCAKRFHRHYRGQWHYSTGTVGRPPTAVRSSSATLSLPGGVSFFGAGSWLVPRSLAGFSPPRDGPFPVCATQVKRGKLRFWSRTPTLISRANAQFRFTANFQYTFQGVPAYILCRSIYRTPHGP